MSRPEKRWKEVAIQPALIRADGDRDARRADHRDGKLSDETRNRIFGSREPRSVRSEMGHVMTTLCYPSASLRWLLRSAHGSIGCFDLFTDGCGATSIDACAS